VGSSPSDCIGGVMVGMLMRKISLNNLIFISIKLPIIKKKSKVGLKPVHIQWVQEFKSSPIVS
jgi:hypothetical protein